jgi:uncharacterized repeat protein (TIGR03809 family)
MMGAIRRLLVILSMQARSTALSSEQVARRWRDLANRRRSHFVELYESGRWKLYYTEAEFILRLREVFQAAEQWEKLASPQLTKTTS